MIPLFLSALFLIMLGVGYWITTRVPDEIPSAAKPVLAAYIILTLALFAFFSWWQAALLVGALLIGWLFGIIALAVIATTPAFSLPLAFIGISVALLLGARFRFEEQNKWTLIGGSLLFFAFALVLRFVI